MKLTARTTKTACFIGYIVQAIVNNFVPLLFVTFESTYQIPLSNITLLITINFAIQLLIDLTSAFFVDKIGYRKSAILAHVCAAAGLVGLTFLPDLLPSPFLGITIAVVIYAIGGGLIEVLISPIVESCPFENKQKTMSLLHSFYCWGHVGVVLLSTGFFAAFGTANWKLLTLIWATIPLLNLILFIFVPIYPITEEGEKGASLLDLAKQPVFWVLMLMMFCSGASELAISQWASLFAEQGLGVSKTIGDLTGPMAFAFLMGTSRLIYGKFGDHLNLDRFMKGSAMLCVASYLIIALAPIPWISLVGCAICGFSVGILWPGSFSKASSTIKNGGTALFAMLALAGDLGGSGGPTFAGLMSGLFGGDLKMGILCAIVFPILMLIALFIPSGNKKAEKSNDLKRQDH